MVVECFETGTRETLYHVGVSMSFNWSEYDLSDPIFNNPTFTAQATLKWAKEVLGALKRL